jgi:hypothetical protein
MSNNGTDEAARQWLVKHWALVTRVVVYIIAGTIAIVTYAAATRSNTQRITAVEGVVETESTKQQAFNSECRERIALLDFKLDAIHESQSEMKDAQEEMRKDIKRLLSRGTPPP